MRARTTVVVASGPTADDRTWQVGITDHPSSNIRHETFHETASTSAAPLVQVYQPLEFLLAVAAVSTIAEAVLPPLVTVQQDTVRQVVRAMLSLTYVVASAVVVFNVKKRIVKQQLWEAELQGARGGSRQANMPTSSGGASS
jgi:hypothetical protein